MRKLYFATGNKGKYESLSKDLEKYGIILSYKKFSFKKELDSDSLEDIATDKVLRAYKKIKKPVICLDAGFFIAGLDNYPGTKVNRALKKDGIEGILKRAENTGRFCSFRQCLAYLGPDVSHPMVFTSTTWGYLAEEKKGSMEGKPYLWSELGLVFIPEGEVKTLAEMNREEYLSWRKKRGESAVGAKFSAWYSARKVEQLFFNNNL